MRSKYLPRWILRVRNYDEGGFRPIPRPKIVEMAERREEVKSHSLALPFSKFAKEDNNVEHWEYRFWCIDNKDLTTKENPMAVCRVCEEIFLDPVARRQHFKQKGCSKTLIKAFELLLRDKKCVICDASTSNTKWGMPLCAKGDCEERWKHDEAQPLALTGALDLALRGKVIVQ